MDNVAKLKKDIEALKKGIDNPSTPENFKDKMRSTMAMLQKKLKESSGESGGSGVVRGVMSAVNSMPTTSRPPKPRRKPRGYGEGYDISEDEMRDYEPEKPTKPTKPRGSGKPNPDFAKVQQIAKELKAKDPSLKHTKAVSMAWEQIRGGSKPAKPAKPASKPSARERASALRGRIKEVGSSYSYRQNGAVRTFQRDKDKDGVRYAKPVGKRVSADGNTYYEYRDNRADSNIGKRSYKKPRLFAKGGEAENPLSYYKYSTKKVKIAFNGKIQMGSFYSADEAMDAIKKQAQTKEELTHYSIVTPDKVIHLGKEYAVRYADGGRVSDMADYIAKYDIKSIEVEMDGKKVTLEGSQLLDGIYVKKGSFMAGGMTYQRGGNTGNYNYKRSWKMDRARVAMKQDYEKYYKRKTK